MAILPKQIRILFIEDLASDYELALRVLKKENLDFTSVRVERAEEMIFELNNLKPHLIISDYSMPIFNGMEALKIAIELVPHLPFIMLTGSMNEETAVKCMKMGATDYVIKERITRLPFAVNEALEKSRLFDSKRKAEQALVKSEERFRRLAENAQDLIYRYEFIPNRQFTYVSPSATQLTGYTPDEHYADPNLAVNMVHPEDKQYVESIGRDFDNLTKPITIRWIKKDGKVIWIEQKNVYMFNGKGDLFAVEGVVRDITERKQSEIALKEMQLMAQATLDSISANICVVDDSGNILSVNKSWIEFATNNSENWNKLEVGANYFTACKNAAEPDKDAATQFLWGIHLVFRGDKECFEMEYECHSPTERRWFVARVTPFESVKTKHKRVVITHENITQQKLAENSVRESEERYSSFLNSTVDIAFIKDEGLRFIFINKTGELFYGKPQSEIIGFTDFDLLDHEFAHNCSLSDKQSLQSNKLVLNIETFNSKIFETRKFPIKLKNGKIGVAGFIRDVTDIHSAQKAITESERKYRDLVENSLVGVYKTNTKGEFLFANTALCEIFEYDSPRDLISTDAKSIYKNPADRDTFLKAIYETGKVSNYEIEMLTAKGNVKNIIISAAISKNTISGMLLDITDRKQIEQELLAKQYEIETQNEEYRVLNEELNFAVGKAQESDKLKTAFLQNLSHEIRTPLNGIVGFTQLLKDKRDNFELSSQYIDIIEKSSDRLVNLISDLVDIAKIETGQVSLNFEEFNVNETLKELYVLFNKLADEKGLAIKVSNYLPSTNSIINSDKGKIYQVLSNLIKNALKFTETGTIEFGCIKDESKLEFFVKDTGIGISNEKQQVVFDRFVQGDTSLSRGYEGSGLGLSISKAFVEEFGGQISVESEPGKGSMFTFTIPCANLKLNSNLPSENETVFNQINKDMKVLVVEDDVVSRMLLGEILKDCEFSAEYARNGQEAVDKVKADDSFDFILMDLKMPIMNGYEATDIIRGLGYSKPIIAQTAYAGNEDKNRVNAGGFSAYLSKPINKSRLLETLNKVLGI